MTSGKIMALGKLFLMKLIINSYNCSDKIIYKNVFVFDINPHLFKRTTRIRKSKMLKKIKH